jgi:membrane associated rhomboid family serine protease
LIPLHDPDIGRHGTPYVTIAIIGLNVLVSLVTLLVLNDIGEIRAIYRFGAIPSVITGGEGFGLARLDATTTIDLASPIPATMTVFTSMFMHAGWMHLGGNMVYLWVFGDNIEDRLGHTRYLLFYLAVGVVAVAAHIMTASGSDTPLIGASGAVAGVLGAYIVLHPKSRIDTIIMTGFIFHVRLPALVLLGGWILFQVFFGAATLGADGGGVAYFAHVGGFIAGAGVFAILRFTRIMSPDRRRA